MPFGSESECSLQVRERRGSVETDRPLPGEGEEPEGRSLELRCELGLARRPGKLVGCPVVIGENIGQVLDAISRFGFEPLCCGDVTRSSGGSRQLSVCDVARE